MRNQVKVFIVALACLAGITAFAQEAVQKEKALAKATGDWYEMNYSEKLVQGEKFQFEVKVKNVKAELFLVCAFHWFEDKDKYGGVLEIIGKEEDVKNDKLYKFQPVMNGFPKEAKYVKIVIHTSPSGNWEDLVNKADSPKIPIVKVQK
jgi:hypothetical protein